MDNKKFNEILAWIIKIGGIVLGLLYFVPAFTTRKDSLSALELLWSGKVKISSDSSKRYAMHPELLLLLLIPAAIAVLWFIFKVNKDKLYLLVGTVVGAFVELVLWFVFSIQVQGISSKISAGAGFILGIILSILYLIVTVLYLLIEFNVINISKIFAAAAPAPAADTTPIQPMQPVQPAQPVAEPVAAPVAEPAVQPVIPEPVIAEPVIAEPVIAEPVSDGTWICPDCGGTDNTGNFCKSCGSAKP